MNSDAETSMTNPDDRKAGSKSSYNMFLLMVAGLGGLLYGVDVGIIGGALPYLQATSHLDNAQISIIVQRCCWAACFQRFLPASSQTGSDASLSWC